MLRGRRREPTTTEAPPTGNAVDASAVQIFAHGLIAELFGAGLRVQNLRARVDDDVRAELEQIADLLDKAIGELREFAFKRS